MNLRGECYTWREGDAGRGGLLELWQEVIFILQLLHLMKLRMILDPISSLKLGK